MWQTFLKLVASRGSGAKQLKCGSFERNVWECLSHLMQIWICMYAAFLSLPTWMCEFLLCTLRILFEINGRLKKEKLFNKAIVKKYYNCHWTCQQKKDIPPFTVSFILTSKCPAIPFVSNLNLCKMVCQKYIHKITINNIVYNCIL